MLRCGVNVDRAIDIFGTITIEETIDGLRLAAAGWKQTPVDIILNDDALTHRFPYAHPEYALRGMINPSFLDPHGFVDRLLPALDAIGQRARIIVLRMAPIAQAEPLPFGDVLGKLDRFLALLPRPYRFAIEPPNASALRPEYFACLRRRGVAHVFGEGDGLLRPMPPVSEQLSMPGALAPPVCVVRSTALARIPGIAWPEPDAMLRRQGWADAVRRCLAAGATLHLFIDDESDPLRSLGALMAMLNDDLARRSVIRRRAA
jgi:hypothetical protein